MKFTAQRQSRDNGVRTLTLALICFVQLLANSASAALITSYQFYGKGNWSIDGVGGIAPVEGIVGTLAASVPPGSTVEKAYLYVSTWEDDGTVFNSIDFDGTTLTPEDFEPLGINPSFSLQAYRADVTAQVAAKVGNGSNTTFSFDIVSEDNDNQIDGEVLAIIYSNPSELTRTLVFFDGFSATSGDSFLLRFAQPLPLTSGSRFEAFLSLGIGFSFQPGQYSIVSINGRTLTSSAGGADDGQDTNGGLLTVGGIGDLTDNPADPNAAATSTRSDDELYNLAAGSGTNSTPFLLQGDTQMQIFTQNPSNDDNIFFAGINITAEATVLGLIPIDISPYANSTLGASYLIDPLPTPGNITLGGVPFILSSGTAVWNGDFAAKKKYSKAVLEVPVNQPTVSEVYLLANTWWGVKAQTLATVELVFESGTYQKNLRGNQDIRDFQDWIFTNKLDPNAGTQVFSSSSLIDKRDGKPVAGRIDMIRIGVPLEFQNSRLLTVRVIDRGGRRFQRVLIAGLTVRVGSIPN